MWLSGIRNVPAIELRTPIWCLTCLRSGRVAGSTSQTSSKPPVAIDLTLPRPELRRRHLREERSFRWDSRAARVAIRTRSHLPEHRKAEGLP